jgi:hypothetical protein
MREELFSTGVELMIEVVKPVELLVIREEVLIDADFDVFVDS